MLRAMPGEDLEPAEARSRPHLRWTDASGPHTFEVTDVLTAGSAPVVDLVVSDRAVSRVHAELVPRHDGLWVHDLESRNGTYVSGVKISEARVPQGGILRLGTTEITVTYGQTAAPELWPESHLGPLFGRSAAMRELFRHIAGSAPSVASVLVSGEIGTGKGLVARALHDLSPRAGGPFVVVDCAALPHGTLENELYYYMETSNGGTLYLQEVGELPLPLQPRLLRLLKSYRVRHGDTTMRSAPVADAFDTRLIVSTHRDLRVLANRGAFREDLYFEIAQVTLRVPPLRDRMADLPALLAEFLGPEGTEALHDELLEELTDLPWLGNVRELRNVAERMIGAGGWGNKPRPGVPDPRALAATAENVIGGIGTTMDLTGVASEARKIADAKKAGVGGPSLDTSTAEVPAGGDAGGAAVPSLPAGYEHWYEIGFKEFRDKWTEIGEREYLRRLMARTNRSSSAASREAGLERTYLYRLLKKHGF